MNLPIVRIREGALPRPWGQSAVPWRQCEVIADDSVIVVDMEPALFGWNFGRVTRQGPEDWWGMNAAAILAFKGDDDCAREATAEERTSVLTWLEKNAPGERPVERSAP